MRRCIDWRGQEHRKKTEWQHTYRALHHGDAKRRFNKIQGNPYYFGMPKSIVDLGTEFINMQFSRHKADYDPHYEISKNDLLKQVEDTKKALYAVRHISAAEKRALAAYLLFDQRAQKP